MRSGRSATRPPNIRNLVAAFSHVASAAWGSPTGPTTGPWNSYAALAGSAGAPSFLTDGLARSLLGGASGYRDFVADGNKNRLSVV
ncbi:MAG TPA: hypothetical protein VII51_05540 [Gaiellaceae bacterium]